MIEGAKPCPFCSCEHASFVNHDQGYPEDDCITVECANPRCEAEGPPGRSEEEALALWNNRRGASGELVDDPSIPDTDVQGPPNTVVSETRPPEDAVDLANFRNRAAEEMRRIQSPEGGRVDAWVEKHHAAGLRLGSIAERILETDKAPDEVPGDVHFRYGIECGLVMALAWVAGVEGRS